MHTQSLTQFDPSRFFQPPTTDPQAGRTITAQVGAIQSSTDFSGKVSVVTAEGDKVTFSLDAETDFRYANYQYKSQSADSSLEVTGEYAESSVSQTLGLTVEGDLNDQEVADLTKLFAKVTSIFRKFFRGQEEQAVAKTAKLADRFGSYSTLAGLDMSVDVTRSVTMLAAQLATKQAAEPVALPSTPEEGPTGSPTLQQGTQNGVPTAGAAIPPPSTDTMASTTEAVTTDAAIPSPSTGITAPTQPANATPSSSTGIAGALLATAPASEPSQPSSIVQQVLDAIQEARVEPQKLNKYFARFLKDLGEALKNGKQAERHAERNQTNQPPNVPSQTGGMAYQSPRQTAASLSIRT